MHIISRNGASAHFKICIININNDDVRLEDPSHLIDKLLHLIRGTASKHSRTSSANRVEETAADLNRQAIEMMSNVQSFCQ